MHFLNDHKDLGYISVKELASAINGDRRTIQLPAFQRDAVWDEGRIALLWDSLVRDYPIGSLLFARATGVYKPIEPAGESGATNVSDSTEFIIIDGQQRANAIALGNRRWSPGEASRLWIDLGELPGEPVEIARFYVCTWREPWGKEATGGKHASDQAKREALSFLGLKQLDIKAHECWLGKTWPLAATLPVPLAELLEWLGTDGRGDRDQLLETYAPDKKKGAVPHQELDRLFDNLINIANKRIPVYVVDRRDANELHVIFQRLNTQGVAMTAQDLFFSALKVEWPEAHDLVWEIYRDLETGRFLRQTDIVHLAVRLAGAKNKRDFPSLSPESFRAFARATDGNDETYLESVKSYLQKPYDGIGRLHDYLRRAREVLAYDPETNGNDDPGLPAPLLARLQSRVWHTLVAWIQNHDVISGENRRQMIRYALLDHFYLEGKSTALMTVPFQLALNAAGDFPGYAIYLALQARGLLSPGQVLTPTEYKSRLFNPDHPDEPVWSVLQNERELAMWVQRDYFRRWFPYYDPTLYASSALPYDVDHILPRAHMNMQGRVRLSAGGPPDEFWRYRNSVRDDAGNIRYWPKDLNRADGSGHLTQKFILGDAAHPTPKDSYMRTRAGLYTVEEVRAASFMPEELELLKLWATASPAEGSPYDWRGERGRSRILALRDAVRYRRLAMYEALFDSVGWQAWRQDEGEMALPDRIRHYVYTAKIAPARAANAVELALRAGEIQSELQLENQLSAIYDALDIERFYEEAVVELVERDGSRGLADVVWKFRL